MVSKILLASLAGSALANYYYVPYPTYDYGYQVAPVPLNRVAFYPQSYAVPQENPSVKILVDALTRITDDTQKVGDLLKGWEGDTSQIAAINQFNDMISADIEKATASLTGATPFTLEESTALLPVSTKLVKSTKATLKILASKKPKFDELNVSEVVLTSLQTQKDAGTKMNDAIDKLLPEATRSIAKQQFKPIDTAISKAIEAFGGPKYQETED